MSRPVKQYIALVDNHRRPSRMRPSHGRYQVAARSAKQAKELLQEHIKFGSVLIYYEDTEPKERLNYKQIKKIEIPEGGIN